MKPYQLIGEWISYVAKSSNAHGIHSPFVFDFYQTVYRGQSPPDLLAELMEEQRSLFRDKRLIKHHDLGAGSKVHKGDILSVKTLAKASLKPVKEAAFIGRLLDFMQADKALELGTSFGTTTLSMALHAPECEIHTVEGSPEVFGYAERLFQRKNLRQVKAYKGDFDEWLELLFDREKTFDAFIIDGNHRYEALMRYFKRALEGAAPRAFMVFDDIRWSHGMLKAWNEIVRHPAVHISIDLFSMGLVFVHNDFSKQHFILR